MKIETYVSTGKLFSRAFFALLCSTYKLHSELKFKVHRVRNEVLTCMYLGILHQCFRTHVESEKPKMSGKIRKWTAWTAQLQDTYIHTSKLFKPTRRKEETDTAGLAGLLV